MKFVKQSIQQGIALLIASVNLSIRFIILADTTSQFTDPLPTTRAFAELLKNTRLNRDNVPDLELGWHRSVLSQGQVVLNGDAGHLTLFPDRMNPPSGSYLPLAPHLHPPVIPQEDAPYHVLYPHQSPISTNVVNCGPGAGSNPSVPPVPTPSYHHQVTLGGPDLEMFVEDLRPLFRRHGYEIIRSPG